VRIIAATNQDSGRGCPGKAFREDLFYRINVIPITCSLSERGLDVAILATSFSEVSMQNKRRDPVSRGDPGPEEYHGRQCRELKTCGGCRGHEGIRRSRRRHSEKIALAQCRVEQVYSVDFPDEGVNFNDW
jgi:hypothetical protein